MSGHHFKIVPKMQLKVLAFTGYEKRHSAALVLYQGMTSVVP